MDPISTCRDERAVLSRAALILRAYTGAQRVLTLHQITQRTGLPKSTAHRLVSQLTAVGWLEREKAGFRIGMPLFRAGQLADRRIRLRETSTASLDILARTTGMATSLAVLIGSDVLFLDSYSGTRFRLPAHNGARLPASCTSHGKILLAHLPAERSDAILADPLPRRTDRSITDPDVLVAQLGAARETGIALAEGELLDDIICIAAPIWDHAGVIASIAVSGRAGAWEMRRVASALRSAAREITVHYRSSLVDTRTA